MRKGILTDFEMAQLSGVILVAGPSMTALIFAATGKWDGGVRNGISYTGGRPKPARNTGTGDASQR